MTLNGTTAYVSVPHATALNTGDVFTLEAWVKRGTIGTSQGIFGKGAPAYQVYFDAANKLVLRAAGVADIVRSTTALSDRTAFHHLAVTKSGATVRLYIDGVDSTGVVANRTLGNNTAALALGGGTGFLNGALDEVAVYNRALSASAIAAHRAAGAPPAGA